MANKKIAELIANGLRDGMMHPGREGGDPTPVVLPMFRTAGMPPEMTDLVNGTATLLSEAIVELIEAEHEIIDKEQAATFRIADENAERRRVPVYSRTDRQHTEPLFILTITNSPFVTIDEKQLLKGLKARAERTGS